MSESCLITLHHGERQWDLDVPSTVPVRQLVELLVEGLGLPKKAGLRLHVLPYGARLSDDQSLAAANLVDGAILVLGDQPVAASPQATDAIGEGPATGWRSLAPEAPAPVEEKKKPGYAWKKLEG